MHPFPSLKTLSFPPLSLQQYLLVVHCNVGSFPQVSVPEREKSGLEEGRGGSEKAGAMEKRDSDPPGLKSPA